MKIFQITPNYPPNGGGIGSYVYYLSKEISKKGHDVSVIFRGKHDRDYIYDGIAVTEIRVPGPIPFNLPVFRRILEKHLEGKKYDIVHIHSSAMPIIKCESPVMVTSHCCNRQVIPLSHRPIKELDALYRNLLLPIYIRIESKLVRSCDKLTVVSQSLRKEYKKYYHINSSVVSNGVDINLFNNNGALEKENAILFTGSFGVGKGVLDILDIAQLLKDSHPATIIYMIGNGPLKKRIEIQLIKRNLFNVKLINHLSHPQLIDYYRRCKIYLFPTYYEGLPTVILEAMACKLPVVTTNVSGIPEQIDEGINGYMVSPGDIRGFYERVVKLLDNEDLRKSFGEKGRLKVVQNFTWAQVADNVIAVYDNLL